MTGGGIIGFNKESLENMRKINTLIWAVFALFLSSCGGTDSQVSHTSSDKPGEQECQHIYNDEYESDSDGHWQICSLCGETSQKEAHEFHEEIILAPTCEDEGKAKMVCDVCGYEYEKTLDATGHTFSSDWSYDDNYHYHKATCGHDVQSDKAPHEFGDDNRCDICGYVYEASSGLTLELSEDSSSYIVTGIGTCTDSEIYIPNIYNSKPVSALGVDAFRKQSSITKVVIPNGVTTLEKGAFNGCEKLQEVVLPSTLKEIESACFGNLPMLTHIELPEGLETIGFACFSFSSLESVVIPSTVSDMMGSFLSCEALKEVEITEGCDAKLFGTFSNTAIEEITIPKSISVINDEAFSSCDNLKSVILSDSVYQLGERAFDGCSSLTEITFPKNLVFIGPRCFENSGLENAYFKHAQGWYFNSTEPVINDSCKEVTIDFADTKSTATALKSTYVNGYWVKDQKTLMGESSK